MSKIKALMFGLIAALLMTLAACDSVSTATPENEAPLTTQADAIWDCTKYLPTNRTRPGNNGIKYTTDREGRPFEVEVPTLGRASKAKREKACQRKIGNLFGQGTDAEKKMYAGGHIISLRLGGWGGRANVVPQVTKFNGSNWKRIENKAVKCKKSERITMTVTMRYKAGTKDIIPEQWQVDFTTVGDSVNKVFDNKGNGGKNNFKKTQNVIDFLKRNCANA